MPADEMWFEVDKFVDLPRILDDDHCGVHVRVWDVFGGKYIESLNHFVRFGASAMGDR